MSLEINEKLLRGTRDSDIARDGRVKKNAFLPRANGKDRDGLSVSVLNKTYRELHLRKYLIAGHKTAVIRVGAVRSLGFDARLAADVDDPAHALIVGIPDRTIGDGEKLQAERSAELLASFAREYDHSLACETSELPEEHD